MPSRKRQTREDEMNQPLRLGVFLSGGGTTLQNLLDRIGDGSLPATVAVVLSDQPEAYGLERARQAGIPAVAVRRRDCPSRAEFCRQLFDPCREAGVGLVCLAGFLQLVEIPPDFWLRVMNIHPALIPAFCGKGFYGRRVHEAVLEAGVKVTGCTVHFADNQYDHGPIILQRPVPVLEGDTPETLTGRVFVEECRAYPEAIRLFAEGRLRVEGRRCVVLDRRS
jgi:phosphoribosylglycinamide formyltransferase-1